MPTIQDMQDVLTELSLRWNELSNYFFSRFGVERYFVVRPRRKYDSLPQSKLTHDRFMVRVSELMKNSREISICLGEMGHHFIDDSRIIDSLRLAHAQGCRIRIIHGPRVDPETEKIFELSDSGMIEMYKMLEYSPHHFIVMESRTQPGKISVADENPHNEALWRKLSDSEKSKNKGEAKDWKDVYRSRYRVWYIREGSKGYAKTLQELFANRLQGLVPDPKKPDYEHPYPSVMRHILKIVLRNAWGRYFVQPVGLFLDFDMRAFWKRAFSPVVFLFAFVIVSLINYPASQRFTGISKQGNRTDVFQDSSSGLDDSQESREFQIPSSRLNLKNMSEAEPKKLIIRPGYYKVIKKELIPQSHGTAWSVAMEFVPAREDNVPEPYEMPSGAKADVDNPKNGIDS